MTKLEYEEKLAILAYILQDIEREVKNLEDRELYTLAKITQNLTAISEQLCLTNHPESCEVRRIANSTIAMIREKTQQLQAKKLLHRKNLHLTID